MQSSFWLNFASVVDVRPDHLKIVLDILRQHVPNREVWAFGSRAKWTAKDYSDLDLVVMGDTSIGISKIGGLKEAFSESDLPYKVDVVDWATTEPHFRRIIEQNYVVVHRLTVSTKKGGAVSANGWRSSTWGEEISLEYGKALRSYDVATGAYRVFGANGPIGWTARPLAPGPGVILGRKGAYRGVRYSPEPFFVIDTAYYVVPKSDLDMRWLYYAVKHYKLGEVDDGSPIPSTTRAAVSMMPLDVPPRSEQGAISRILGALDDKIELNRRMCETLEAMARALFKSWFIEFDPVRAKSEGRDAGVPSPLSDSFPQCLVDSDFGEIPEGWETATLGDHFDADRGVSYSGENLAESGVLMHNLNSIYEGGGYKLEGAKHYRGEYRDDQAVVAGDVIVANTEQGHERLLIGYAAIVPSLPGTKGMASHHLYRMRAKQSSYLTNHYLCYLLNSRRMHDLVSGMANGTTVNMLPVDGVRKPRLVVPPAALVACFDRFAVSIGRRCQELKVEMRELAGARDALLPRLMSGQLLVGGGLGHADKVPA